jgi:hypothetical protein
MRGLLSGTGGRNARQQSAPHTDRPVLANVQGRREMRDANREVPEPVPGPGARGQARPLSPLVASCLLPLGAWRLAPMPIMLGGPSSLGAYPYPRPPQTTKSCLVSSTAGDRLGVLPGGAPAPLPSALGPRGLFAFRGNGQIGPWPRPGGGG